ncbi:MAG: SIS domain-containing protein [Chloroflexota bacterium]|nr:SIS domain-containing protein [Chloroflexota bacterium]
MRLDELKLKWESMEAGIDAQPAYLREGAARMLFSAAHELTSVPSRIYLVGCGDSHYAGLATRYAFERWSGIPTEALESLEFSRYAIDAAPSDSLLVAVSNSGRVARTIECAVFARRRGIATIALTYDPESRLARESAMTLPWSYQDVGFGPGTLSYLASLVSLYALAVRLGQLVGRLSDDEVATTLDRIAGTADAVASTIRDARPVAATLARQMAPDSLLTIIGGGPNYGTALFGSAKFIESARHPAVGQELEEWAHEQYFCTGPGTHTLVIAPAGRSIARGREQLQAVRDVGGTAVAICAPADAETAALADAVLPAHDTGDETLSPIVTAVPLELAALEFARHLGRTMLGFDDETRRTVNFRQIFDSVIPDS